MCRVRASCLSRSRTESPEWSGSPTSSTTALGTILQREGQRLFGGRGDQALEVDFVREVVEDAGERLVVLDDQDDARPPVSRSRSSSTCRWPALASAGGRRRDERTRPRRGRTAQVRRGAVVPELRAVAAAVPATGSIDFGKRHGERAAAPRLARQVDVAAQQPCQLA